MSNQVAIKEVLNCQVYDFATGNPLYYFDYAETTEIDNAGQRLILSGGQGNYSLVSFDHTKTSTMKMKLPLVDTNLLATLMGDTVNIGAQNILKREVVTVAAGSATLSATPVSGTTTSVFYLSGSRDNGTAFTVSATPTAGQYSITGSTMTFNTGDNGKSVVVWYTYATPSTTTKFSMTTNKFVAPVKIVGNGIVRDQVTGTDRASVITIYNGRFKPNFNITMASTAATSLDLELDMFSVTQGNNYVYYDVVYLT